MADDDEDVIFDQAGLLTNHVKSRRDVEGSRPGLCLSLVQAFCLCSGFFGLGLCLAIPGPTLLDLQTTTHTNTEQISRIFTGRSVGYLVGSVIGGFMYDRINQNLLLCVTLFVTGLATAAAPWSTTLITLMVLISFQGLSLGFLDVGGNVMCINIWGRRSGPYMQAMHFALGFGAFVAPLIAEPFLAVPIATNTTNVSYGPLMSTVTVKVDTPEVITTVSPGTDTRKRLARSLVDIHHFKRDAESPDQTEKPKTTEKHLSKEQSHKPMTNGEHLSKKLSHADGRIIKDRAKTNQNEHQKLLKTSTVKPSKMSVVVSQKQTKYTTIITTMSSTTSMQRTTNAPLSNMSSNATESTSATAPGPLAGVRNKVKQLAGQVGRVINNLTRVQFAYLVIAVYLVILSWGFCFLCCKGKRTFRAVKNQEIDMQMLKSESMGFRVQILVLVFFFYFLYMGIEVTYGNLIMTFSVKYLRWTKQRGTMLTSVFWGSFAVGRALAVFLAKCLSPAMMLISDLIVTCLSLLGIVIALDSNNLILWFCTGTLGVGLASIFPTGITWAERYMHITGKATAVFVVGSALGEMAVPTLTGYLFQHKGAMWLMYILLGSGIVSAVLYIIMQNLASNRGERYEKLASLLSSSLESEDLQMDLMPNSENVTSRSSSHAKKKVTFKLGNDKSSPSISPSTGNVSGGKRSMKKD